MLDKQINIYSVDTGNFYSNKEARLHWAKHKLRAERNLLVNGGVIKRANGKTRKTIVGLKEIESKITKLLSNKNGYIISTGGGIVLNYENIINLKRNGVLVYLDRPFNKLEISDSRPLSSSKNKLKKMYRKRRRLYKKYADYIIKNDSDIEDIIQNLIFMLSVNY